MKKEDKERLELLAIALEAKVIDEKEKETVLATISNETLKEIIRDLYAGSNVHKIVEEVFKKRMEGFSKEDLLECLQDENSRVKKVAVEFLKEKGRASLIKKELGL